MFGCRDIATVSVVMTCRMQHRSNVLEANMKDNRGLVKTFQRLKGVQDSNFQHPRFQNLTHKMNSREISIGSIGFLILGLQVVIPGSPPKIWGVHPGLTLPAEKLWCLWCLLHRTAPLPEP